jgi:small subunit ribosomal protein S5
VRTVLELAGVKNVISKSLGSQNRINVARATMLALASLRTIAPAAKIPDVEETSSEANDAAE